MAGIKKLRKIQFGLEVAASEGGAVVATKIWRGTGTIEDQLEMVFPEEDIGILPGVDRSYISKLAAQIALDDTPLTFEQLPLLLCIGLDDIISGAADGPNDWIHTFAFVTTDPGFRAFTVEGGDDYQAEEMEYAVATEITLKGAAGESWMMSGTLVGRQVSLCSFTTPITVPAVEEALFSKTKMYIAGASGGMGQPWTKQLLDAEISITTGLLPVFSADGELFFSYIKRAEPEITIAVTFEHDSGVVAEKVNWRAKTTRRIMFQCYGSALTAGGAHAYKTLDIRGNGRWEKFDKIDEVEGNDVIRGLFRCRYNAASSEFFRIIVVNEVENTIAE